MDFYLDGGNLGITFSGITGLLFLFYIVIEILSLSITKTFLLHKIFIWWRVKKQIPTYIPIWWHVKNIGLIAINYQLLNDEFVRKVYIKAVRNIPEKDIPNAWINGWVYVNFRGRIVDVALDSIDFYDKEVPESIKNRFNRDKVLKDLGI